MSLANRIALALLALLLAFCALVALIGHSLAQQREAEALQRLSHGLARHIVTHWPQVVRPQQGRPDERAEREALLQMLMTVNPGIEVYLLDADGRVDAYLGDPAQVRQSQVDLGPVRAFLAGLPMPLRGSDPKAPAAPKLFSAAMFAPRPGDTRPPGYLYVVLEGQARHAAAGGLDSQPAWRGAALVAGSALAVTLLLGLFVSRRLTRPLARLAAQMQAFNLHGAVGEPAAGLAPADEVAQLGQAFNALRQRVAQQVQTQAEQAASHREVVASLAHDLRTPLTVLHAHLEALYNTTQAAPSRHHLGSALAHSDKLRTLSQQLCELATLQSTDHVLQRERFRLDELVSDTVQKLELAELTPTLALQGPPPGRIDLDGDLLLIERAITNLIGNALRHARSSGPVKVQLQRDGSTARVLIQDQGPGLPLELARRLDAGEPVRDAAPTRPGGGVGGLGLAIAQRVAWLHGGKLCTLPAPEGGTRLCLALPVAPGA